MNGIIANTDSHKMSFMAQTQKHILNSNFCIVYRNASTFELKILSKNWFYLFIKRLNEKNHERKTVNISQQVDFSELSVSKITLPQFYFYCFSSIFLHFSCWCSKKDIPSSILILSFLDRFLYFLSSISLLFLWEWSLSTAQVESFS